MAELAREDAPAAVEPSAPGKRHLEQAAAETGIEVRTDWQPFFLNHNTPAEGEDADTPALAGESYALVSQLPADDPAGEQVWRLGYSGRAAYDDRTTATRACAGGGTLSTGIGVTEMPASASFVMTYAA